MAASEDEFIGKYSIMAASQRQLQRHIYFKKFLHIFYISYFDVMLKRHVKEERIFMTFFSKGFGAKCKHAELALNFIQKQSFSEIKTHFPFILVE